MNVLEKIIKQDLIIAKEKEKLQRLHKEYVEENRKYSNDSYVQFDNSGIVKNGKIIRAQFKSEVRVGIKYLIRAVNANGALSKKNKKHYWVWEKDVKPHLVLNAMHS